MRPLKIACAFGLVASATMAAASPAYRLAETIPLSAPDRWDYVVFSPATGHVYVAHGDRLTVVDPLRAAIVGDVQGIAGGTHGTAIDPASGQGFTDDGKAGQAVAFDLKTLKITKAIPAAPDADGIAFDPSSGHVFVVEGDPASVTVIDPRSDTAPATITVGEKLEYAAADGKGSLFVAGEEKGDLVKIDTRANRVTAHYPAPGCTSPHGLAIDRIGRRVFMGCANGVMTVTNADDGRLIGTFPIGRGNDAMAYDPQRHRVFSSNGLDGTISVYAQVSPDRYVALDVLRTMVSGRTMSLDPKTGRLFVAAAETDPPTTPGGRPKPRAGTLKLLVFDPVG